MDTTWKLVQWIRRESSVDTLCKINGHIYMYRQTSFIERCKFRPGRSMIVLMSDTGDT